MTKVLVDSCVFINTMKADSVHRDECHKFLEQLDANDITMLMPSHGLFEIWCNLKRIELLDKKYSGQPINGNWIFPIEAIHIDEHFLNKYSNLLLPYIKAGDHIYIAIAKTDGLPLVSTDNGMLRVAKEVGVQAFLPSEYPFG
jgi:predicted nucleic acid-binding protein